MLVMKSETCWFLKSETCWFLKYGSPKQADTEKEATVGLGFNSCCNNSRNHSYSMVLPSVEWWISS
ncbi:hypothetical protein LINPERPRIM_LOCUS2456 [Linum perenne]